MLNEVIIHLNNAMKAVQNLQIQPTEHNCEQILTAITGIRKAASVATKMNQKITELEKAIAAAETDAGADQAAADPDEFEDRER